MASKISVKLTGQNITKWDIKKNEHERRGMREEEREGGKEVASE